MDASSSAPVGMQRLSCLPCRRRKSKCDRDVPCSSCVLRNTEKFCYSSDVKADSSVPTHLKPEKGIKAQSHGPRRQSSNSNSERPSKQRKVQRRESSADLGEHVGIGTLGTSLTIKPDGGGKDGRNVAATIASVRETLRDLQQELTGESVAAEGTNKISQEGEITFDDLSSILPSLPDCDVIVDCFLSQLYWHCTYIHRPTLEREWKEFRAGTPKDREFVGSFCIITALSILLAPSTHAASRLPHPRDRDHTRFMEIAFKLLYEGQGAFTLLPETMERLTCITLMTSYFAFGGYPELGLQNIGSAVRLGKTLQLFDESSWEAEKLTPLQIELRRRLAWEVSICDRWVSTHFMRDADLQNIIKVKPPSYYTDESYNVGTGEMVLNPKFSNNADFVQAKIVLHIAVRDAYIFLTNFNSMTSEERYVEARNLEAYLDNALYEAFAPHLRYESACQLRTNDPPEKFVAAAQSLIGFCACARVRCGVLRKFLRDENAPADLRYGALHHARKIIETIPTLVTLSTCPWISFFSGWCSTMLFHAASTFAIVFLTEDNAVKACKEKHDTNLPEENLNWFANNIFEVIETLSLLSEKDRVAKQCESLLLALCTSRDKLREMFEKRKSLVQRLHATRSAPSANQGLFWSGARIVDGGSYYPAWQEVSNEFEMKKADKPGSNWTGMNSTHGNSSNQSPESIRGNASLSTSDSQHHGDTVKFRQQSTSSPWSSHNGSFDKTAATDSTSDRTTAPSGSSSGMSPAETSILPIMEDTQWAELLSQLDNDLDAIIGDPPATH